MCVAAGRGGRRSVGLRESWFKGERPCSQTGDLGATRRQRAFFSFPPPQQRPAFGPNAILTRLMTQNRLLDTLPIIELITKVVSVTY